MVPGSPYYNPDQEYGRSLLDSPHKIVISPIFQLPFGEGKKFCRSGLGQRPVRRLAGHAGGHVLERVPDGRQPEPDRHRLPLGGTPRPNIVAGPDFLVPGDITDRIKENTTDNLYLNKAAFTTAATQPVRQRASHAARRAIRRGATTLTCRWRRHSRPARARR